MGQYARFESEITIRPDDIDMNNHVHNSRYLDYVLAARYDQMQRCYKMSMEEFVARGFGWVVKSCSIAFKRPLMLHDDIIVRTGIESIMQSEVRVRFEIVRRESGKIAADGYCDYTMVNLSTGRAQKIPEDIVGKYSV